MTLPALHFDHFGSGQVEDSERNSALAPYWRDAHVLVSLLRMMAHEAAIWFHIAQRLSKLESRDNLDASDKEDLLALYEECRRLGLIMSCLSISRLVRWLDSPVRREDESYAIKELNRRIVDEMAATLFLYVPRERSDYYTDDELFGHDVADVFPSHLIRYRRGWQMPGAGSRNRMRIPLDAGYGDSAPSSRRPFGNTICAELGILHNPDY